MFSTLQTIMARWEQEGVGQEGETIEVPLVSEKASRNHQVTTAKPIREESGKQSEIYPPVSPDYVRRRSSGSKQFLVSGRMINTVF